METTLANNASSKGKPLISIIMPVRDWRSTTASAAISILEQSYQPLELLLVGQADTQELARQLQQARLHDARIRILGRQAPGIVGALNTGLAAARGEYIGRMDDDDIAYPTRLASQLAHLKGHPEVQLCATRVRFIDKDCSQRGVAQGNRRYARWLNRLTTPAPLALACHAENPMPHPTLMAHRRVWNTLGGYRELDGPEDHDLMLRAMLQGIGMGKPEAVLQDWREHDDRLTRTDSRYRRQAFVNRSAWAIVQPGGALGAANARGVWIAGTGKHARFWHDALITQGVDVYGFVDMASRGQGRHKRSRPIISYEQLALERNTALLISAVTQPDARTAITTFCTMQGWTEGLDFIVG